MFGAREHVEAGGLMPYEANIPDRGQAMVEDDPTRSISLLEYL
jgi:hypothetical protein